MADQKHLFLTGYHVSPQNFLLLLIIIRDSMLVQWLVLSPHSKRALCSCTFNLFFSSGYTGSPTAQRQAAWFTWLLKIAHKCDCECECLFFCVLTLR